MATEIIWSQMASLATTIHVLAVIIVILMYHVYHNYESVKVLQQEHKTMTGVETFGGINVNNHEKSYVSRLPQVASHTGADAFLGAYGPPVFYDIGDAKTQRDYQASQAGKVSTSNEYNIDYTQKYASGRPMFEARTGSNGKIYYISLPDNATEGMLSDESLLARAQGFRSY
jgi:hypothetical protein